MGLGALKLFKRVAEGAVIAGMFYERLMSPGFGTLPVVVVAVVFNEQNRKLAPGDYLVEKAIARGLRNLALGKGIFDCERDGDGADVAEVKIRREAAGAFDFRMIAFIYIVFQPVAYEFLEVLESGMSSASERVDGLDGAIEIFEASW